MKQVEGRAGQDLLNTRYASTSFSLSHGAPSISWRGGPWAQELGVRELVQDWWRRIFHLPFAQAFGYILCSVSYWVVSHVGVLKWGKSVSLVSWAELVLRNAEKLGKRQTAKQRSELHAEFSIDYAVGR